MLCHGKAEHELWVHVGASRTSESDARYRSQLRGFLDFEAVRLDGQSIGIESQEQVSNESLQDAVSAELSTSAVSMSAAPSAFIHASPLVHVKRTPAGLHSFNPVPETPLNGRGSSKWATFGQSAASQSTLPSDLPPTVIPDSLTQRQTSAKELKRSGSSFETRIASPLAKKNKMSSDSESSTEYPVPRLRQHLPKSPRAVLGDLIDSTTVQPAAPQNTQEAYEFAARDLADVIQTEHRGTPQLSQPGGTALTSASTPIEEAIVDRDGDESKPGSLLSLPPPFEKDTQSPIRQPAPLQLQGPIHGSEQDLPEPAAARPSPFPPSLKFPPANASAVDIDTSAGFTPPSTSPQDHLLPAVLDLSAWAQGPSPSKGVHSATTLSLPSTQERTSPEPSLSGASENVADVSCARPVTPAVNELTKDDDAARSAQQDANDASASPIQVTSHVPQNTSQAPEPDGIPCNNWPAGENWYLSCLKQVKSHGRFKTHVTEALKALSQETHGALLEHQSRFVIHHEPIMHDRGCWVFRLPSTSAAMAWTEGKREDFWEYLDKPIKGGKWGSMAVEQLAARTMENERFGFSDGQEAWAKANPDDDWVRLFCWGEAYKEAWCVLFEASSGSITRLPDGMRWVTGNGCLVEFTPA